MSELRREPLGQCVGYAIGQQRVLPRPPRGQGRVLFATTGWLLQSLSGEADAQSDSVGYTHIILDEVHEYVPLTPTLGLGSEMVSNDGRQLRHLHRRLQR